LQQTGLKPTEKDYYAGPSVGYTTEELEQAIGKVVLDMFDESDLQIVWKPR